MNIKLTDRPNQAVCGRISEGICQDSSPHPQSSRSDVGCGWTLVSDWVSFKFKCESFIRRSCKFIMSEFTSTEHCTELKFKTSRKYYVSHCIVRLILSGFNRNRREGRGGVEWKSWILNLCITDWSRLLLHVDEAYWGLDFVPLGVKVGSCLRWQTNKIINSVILHI